MNSEKVKTFIEVAGNKVSKTLQEGTPEQRKLGAQLLLSELLEYIIRGLGVVPSIHGVEITDPESIHYAVKNQTDLKEMVDGLADVAYTMYWNSETFGVPLEKAFELVSDNNLEKFVEVHDRLTQHKLLASSDWHCDQNIAWPAEVAQVEIVAQQGKFYAVGKDSRGKVRKPSTYKSVDLSPLLAGL